MFVNLTPHAIRISLDGGTIEVPPSGTVARRSVSQEAAGTIDGVPVFARKFGPVENLPEPIEGTVFIVSSLVLDGVTGRSDVVAPDTGATAIRDEAGRIVAVRQFVR